jgi:small redox-active disulfide protein 2
MLIQVCGPGCASCNKAEQVVKEALAESGVTATVEKVSDFAAMAKLGILSTPSIVIDGKIKCVGKVPNKNEVLDWLNKP